MTTGFISMIWITVNAFRIGKSHIPLPFNADNCPHLLSNATVDGAYEADTDPMYVVSQLIYSYTNITVAIES